MPACALDVLTQLLSEPLDALLPQQVTKRIDVVGRRLINSVELAPWPGGAIGDALASLPGPLSDLAFRYCALPPPTSGSAPHNRSPVRRWEFIQRIQRSVFFCTSLA